MRFVVIAVLLAACRPSMSSAPRYAAELFSEDTVPVPVTVRVTGPMQVSLNGAGFYMYKSQPVVITPASLVVRGTGSAIIAMVDSSKPIALVPAGTPLDSTGRAAVVARMLKVSRAEGSSEYKLEIHRP